MATFKAVLLSVANGIRRDRVINSWCVSACVHVSVCVLGH